MNCGHKYAHRGGCPDCQAAIGPQASPRYYELIKENQKLKEELLNYGKAVTHFEDKAEKLQQENERLTKRVEELTKVIEGESVLRRENIRACSANVNLEEQIKMLTEALVEAETHLSAIASGLTTDINRVEFETKKRAHEAHVEILYALAKLRQGGGDEKK